MTTATPERIAKLEPPSRDAALRMFRASRSARLRTMREFAEQEIVVSTGPHPGRYRCSTQPFTRLWFDAVDSGKWNRFVATGPGQSSKSLSCSIVPCLYHLFEIGETVVYGVPDISLAIDKWRRDLLPTIERTRYRELLPRTGAGSKGGTPTLIQFGNGAELRFMSGGSGDKGRSGFTSRIVVITETDGLDESGEASREADPVSQLEARQAAFGDRKRTYLECTVSTDFGRTWVELKAGTDSRLALPCPHCGSFCTPEREHLVGWQGAEDEITAAERASFACPDCGALWSEADRLAANRRALLVHRGQEIRDGVVTGDVPRTKTLGFRWSAINNMFAKAGELGAAEWRAQRANDTENADRELRQFKWALPYISPKLDLTVLNAHAMARRTADVQKGIVPPGTTHMTVTMDVGKWRCWWLCIAWQGDRGHVVDYGVMEVATDHLGVERGVLSALRTFRDSICNVGWKDGDKLRQPDQCWIDCRYQPDSVYAFCRESGERYRPSMGRGASRDRTRYNRPKKVGDAVKFIGAEYHVEWIPKEHLWVVQVNADHWKSVAQDRFSSDTKSPTAIQLYRATPVEHAAFTKHLTAEKKVEVFTAGRGTEIKWERQSRDNHWLDCGYNACAAGHFCGLWLAAPARPQAEPARAESFQTPYGDSFIMTRE